MNYPIDAQQVTTFPEFASQPQNYVATANYLYQRYGTSDVLADSAMVDFALTRTLHGYTQPLLDQEILAIWGYSPV
jgi:hypothetical protein